MLNDELLLVPTDFSEAADQALALALWLAERRDAAVHVLHVPEPFETGPLNPLRYVPESARTKEVPEEAVGDLIAATIQRHDPGDVRVESVVLRRRPVVESILSYAEAEGAAHIIVGRNRHRGVLRRRRVGSTTHALLDRAQPSVIVVPADETRQDDNDAGADGAPAVPAIEHVLLPVDFLEQAEQTVSVVRDFAARCEASLSLLFVAERRTVPVFQDTGLFSFATLEPDAEIVERAPDALAQLFRNAGGPDVPHSFHVRKGDDVADEILAFARDEEVSLIALPSAQPDGADHFETGRLTEAVLRRAPCPVGIIRPPNARGQASM